MAKNTGKRAEDDFESKLASLGKLAYFCRLIDAADIKGRTGTAVNAPTQPSDYIVVLDGKMFLAEVKSTQNPTAFPFSLLKKTQSGAAKMISSAGGDYQVFVKSIIHDRWFCIPYLQIHSTLEKGRSSLKWTELEMYRWAV